jgi:hypothetical protein
VFRLGDEGHHGRNIAPQAPGSNRKLLVPKHGDHRAIGAKIIKPENFNQMKPTLTKPKVSISQPQRNAGILAKAQSKGSNDEWETF